MLLIDRTEMVRHRVGALERFIRENLHGSFGGDLPDGLVEIKVGSQKSLSPLAFWLLKNYFDEYLKGSTKHYQSFRQKFSRFVAEAQLSGSIIMKYY